MNDLYRLSWEMVRPSRTWAYSNADPTYYKNTTQVVPNSEIPDEDWRPISKETDNPWAQYDTLKLWADSDFGFVRNVRLERMVGEPRWEPVVRTSGHRGRHI